MHKPLDPRQPTPQLPEEEMREALDNAFPDWREYLDDYCGDIAAIYADVMKQLRPPPPDPKNGWFDPLPEDEAPEDDGQDLWFD